MVGLEYVCHKEREGGLDTTQGSILYTKGLIHKSKKIMKGGGRCTF